MSDYSPYILLECYLYRGDAYKHNSFNYDRVHLFFILSAVGYKESRYGDIVL